MKRNERKDFHEHFSKQMNEQEQAGRVVRSTHGIYSIATESKTYTGTLSGRFHNEITENRDYPAVGDWVIFQPYDNDSKALIQRILQRRTLLSRKKAGTGNEEQIIAANIDAVFIVTALTKEFNVRRLERYVQQVYESGARPVVVCTKRDLCDTVSEKLWQVKRVAPGVPVYAVDSLTGEGMVSLLTEVNEGETISLIGSSGVGKSTLINRLLHKEVQATKNVRESDERGRHTTTHRELFELPEGAFIIDTPGMRELQLWGDQETTAGTFSDIENLSQQCKFRDCQHEQEPGCAVQQAIAEGELEVERLNSFNKLKRELHRLELKDQYGTHRTNRMLHGPNKGKIYPS
ncbi:MAG: ribosome small subunit-dependent GTPase A [Halobacillus sp.]|uniref:ribosome small subunit-dependent GTPase A n=1 Tax=Halobacillus sp. TaxID=56800 RepID=UPI003BB039A4